MAINIPIISEFNGTGIDKAIKEFKQLETAGEKAQFAIKKAAVPAAAALGALAIAGGAAARGRTRDTLKKALRTRMYGSVSRGRSDPQRADVPP